MSDDLKMCLKCGRINPPPGLHMRPDQEADYRAYLNGKNPSMEVASCAGVAVDPWEWFEEFKRQQETAPHE